MIKHGADELFFKSRTLVMNYNQLFKLNCHVQHYAWGARCRGGRKPFIAELESMPADEHQPFAELWIGAHPKLPADVVTDTTTTPLDQFIAAAPGEILGEKLVDRGFESLPFLMKVLDCEQPLSIQAHPDKNTARRLHAADPENYPDANHKPEIAISVQGMDAFCEFRPLADIVGDLHRLNTLSETFEHVLTNHTVMQNNPRQWLRTAYATVFDMPQEQVTDLIQRLVSEINTRNDRTAQDEWIIKLVEQHPNDRGILSAYFLNIIHLAPGQAVFLRPNEPHAYLQGTIIECMASSDNVVRAGLTSKFIDRQTLVEMLTYDAGVPESSTGEVIGKGMRVYRVPVPEFQVEYYEHDSDCSAEYNADGAVSLMLVLDGNAEFKVDDHVIPAPRGSTWLWPASRKTVTVTSLSSPCKIVRARPNLEHT